MDTCRPGWSDDFKQWILRLIEFSLKASVAKYDGNWWRQNNGIPTGGSLCVQLANITVFYIMQKEVYSDPELMAYITELKRFIDDGAGFFSGSELEFQNWLSLVYQKIGAYGLHIDESSIKPNSVFVNFLDIQFCFNMEGQLQTDLYIKETDSRAYLNFSSAHPNHTFSGNVYSQSLRLRRIINSQERLRTRLDELAECFIKAGYPKKMVNEITTKVFNSERNISVKNVTQPEDDGKIRVISTFEADKSIVDAVKKSEENLKLTQSFRNQNGSLFKFVKTVGPNIKSQINSLKKQALCKDQNGAVRCNRKKLQNMRNVDHR